MRQATAALTAYLAAHTIAAPVDLYTFALPGGTTLRVTSGVVPVTAPAPNFPGSPLNYAASGTRSFVVGPRFGRSTISTRIGVEPTELDIEVDAGPSDLIGTFSWQQATEAGLFDGATVELDRFFMPSGADGIAGPLDTSLGAIVWFYGRVADIEAGRSATHIKVRSLLSLIAVEQMPRRLFQSGCNHVFGDAMCGYNRLAGTAADGTPALGAATVAALSGSGQSQISTGFTGLSPSDAYIQGTMTGLSGANAAVSRTIADMDAGGIVYLRRNLPYPVTVGDQFRLLVGCAHNPTACQQRANLARYGGMPYIPPPELAL